MTDLYSILWGCVRSEYLFVNKQLSNLAPVRHNLHQGERYGDEVN